MFEILTGEFLHQILYAFIEIAVSLGFGLVFAFREIIEEFNPIGFQKIASDMEIKPDIDALVLQRLDPAVYFVHHFRVKLAS